MQITNERVIQQTKEHLAVIGRLLFDRKLTDAGGGNVSVRVGDVVCISPTLAGHKRQWQLDAKDFMVIDLRGNILEGDGGLSRETKVHLGLHNAYSDHGTAVIHAHPHHLMVFAAMSQPMPPVLEATLKFGEIQCIDYAPAHSPKLAQNVVSMMKGQEARIAKHAAGVLAPWHGLFLMGNDLDAAFDAVERIDTNAYCILMAHQSFGVTDMLKAQRTALDEAREEFM